jgi:hypothetical protein
VPQVQQLQSPDARVSLSRSSQITCQKRMCTS